MSSELSESVVPPAASPAMAASRRRLLVVSIGGSPEPVLKAIEDAQPVVVIPVFSEDSERMWNESIAPLLPANVSRRPIPVADPQDLEGIYEAIRSGTRQVLAEPRFQDGDVERLADFTGGTKPMSAGMVLALEDLHFTFTYVGGRERTKDGVGVVQSGSEVVLRQAFPWRVRERDSLRDIAALFSFARYGAAAERCRGVVTKVGSPARVFELLGAAATGLDGWDRFDYATAEGTLRSVPRDLHSFAQGGRSRPIQRFADDLSAAQERLKVVIKGFKALQKKVKPPTLAADAHDVSEFLRDLVANAVRRGELEQKFEDAVARLYAAVERTAQARLLLAFGLRTEAVPLDRVPPGLRDDFARRAKPEDQGVVKIGLGDAYRLLVALGDDEVGPRFEARRVELGQALNLRNESFLAHGSQSLGLDAYERLLAVALDLLGWSRADVPSFPVLEMP